VLHSLHEQLASSTVTQKSVAHLPARGESQITDPRSTSGPANTSSAAATAALVPVPGNALVPVPIAASGAAAIAANNDVATKTARAQPQVVRKAGKQLSESDRAELHREQLKTSYADFACNCKIAEANAATSCLDQFSRAQLQALYAETYGSDHSSSSSNQRGRKNQGKKEISLKDVSNALHTHMWALKVELPAVDEEGRKYTIPRWQLDGKEVCREGWQRARGGSDRRIRDLHSMVLRGHGPAERAAGKLAKLELALLDRQAHRENSRKIWTVNWWATELLMHDWLPNEQAVRFRGQGYGSIHKSLYSPAATNAGMKPLCFSAWRQCPKPALQQLHTENKLPGSDPAKLRLKRSAKHSAFPECTTCQNNRKDFHAAASARGADPAVVQQKYQKVLDHQKEWSDDRQVALRLKYGNFHQSSDACYECDDGCGSFWQGLPVDPTGRDSKQNVTAKYKFSVQANVLTGPGGVQRFAVMPKNVRKGANFGLSNLILVLHRAWKLGRLGPHVTRAYRHTDGGPDNVFPVSIR